MVQAGEDPQLLGVAGGGIQAVRMLQGMTLSASPCIKSTGRGAIAPMAATGETSWKP